MFCDIKSAKFAKRLGLRPRPRWDSLQRSPIPPCWWWACPATPLHFYHLNLGSAPEWGVICFNTLNTITQLIKSIWINITYYSTPECIPTHNVHILGVAGINIIMMSHNHLHFKTCPCIPFQVVYTYADSKYQYILCYMDTIMNNAISTCMYQCTPIPSVHTLPHMDSPHC